MSTNEPMTREQLDAVQRRVGNTTEGPWSHWSGWHQWDNCIKGDSDEGMYTVAEVISEAGNARFIANAREDVPALLAEVERLRARPVVDDDMVERAARAMYEKNGVPGAVFWDNESAAIRRTYRRMAISALDAALGTGVGS